MVQSNVTARIKSLETELDVPLFHRHSRGVSITSAGSTLLPYARRIIQMLEEAKRAVIDDAGLGSALVIGSLETTAAVRMPPILAAYHRAFPHVDVTMQTGTEAELVSKVLDYRLEGAFVAGPVSHRDLISEPIVTENLVVVTASSFGSLESLHEHEEVRIVVFRPGCSYRQKFEDFLAHRGIINLRRLEFGTLDGIIGSVSAGIGITLLPETAVQMSAQRGLVKTIKVPRRWSAAQTVFVRRKDAYFSRALSFFVDCARKSF
jgi:DNA-binding transcriptional LysR family regulator